ncbi:hypothetical protein FEM48_Zijuj08G0113400 [Ziziphus jujuba var. spinosa]|uniref:3-ketodihydrosphingosine reductase n=1 Tax=Ziziphus jujuba var. spinosa TaxID=714518 RepID=A0A978UYT0_ZIZJJ|nr:hypothetical protein FEM48_Zijuj08G0113400 [Ziziphus jujuba var. spinosa]
MRSMSSSNSTRGIAAIVGVGPKLGRSIARKFAHEGYTVAILARDLGVLSLGFVEVLVYNAYQPMCWNPTNFTDIRLDSFEKSLAVSSVGAFHCAQQVLPSMVERGRGTILFTGCSASVSGIAGYSELCCGKFALRALSQCLAREFQPMGVHVAHVIIDGVIGPPRGASSSERKSVGEQGVDGSMDPDALAQTYWHLHVQDRTAWTQEIDLRPSTPRFF